MKIQASEVNRIIHCPGSLHLYQTMDKTLEYRPVLAVAERGKKIHKVGENVLGGMAMAQAMKDAGYAKDDNEYKAVTEVAKYYSGIILKDKKKLKGDLIVEEKYRETIQGFECVAKMDAMILSSGRLDVYDLKTGNWDYSSSAFDQLYFTACVVLWNMRKQLSGDMSVVLHIVQPFYYNETERHAKSEYKDYTVEYFLKQIERTLDEITVNTSCTTGNWCTFCPCMLVCPKMGEYLVLVDTLAQAGEHSASIEVLEKIYMNKKNIENYLNAIELTLMKALEAGTTLSLFMRGTGYGHRRWNDDKKVIEDFGYLKDDLFDKKLKSPAQLEKIAGKKNLEGYYNTPELIKLVPRKTEFDEII